MTQTLEIPGTLPNLNDIIAASKVMSPKALKGGKRWSSYAQMKRDVELPIIMLAKTKLKPVKNPVHLLFVWYEKDRRRDLDNIVVARKFCLDALVSAGILPNDNWEWVKGFSDRFVVDKTNPRVKVTLLDGRKAKSES